METITIRATASSGAGPSTAGAGAEIAPGRGGRVARLWFGEREVLVPMTGWPGDRWTWPKAGGYPLVPYSNRIREARLAFRGRTRALAPHPAAAPHSLHGTAQLDPWRVEAAAGDTAALAIDHAADADWPWAFTARQTFRIAPGSFTVEMEIVNTGPDPFPAGLGWHPYVAAGDDDPVFVDATTAWDVDRDGMSTGQAVPHGAEAAVPAGSAYLSGWSRCRLDWSAGDRIEISADPAFGHFIVYRPAGAGYVCLEPITHLSDGFNLAAQGVASAEALGLRALEPGERLAGRITVRHVPADP